MVAGGQSETKNGQVGQHKTTGKVAAACEVLTRRGATGLIFFSLPLGRMKMSKLVL
ncbi:MAG: hypothetical protein O4860_10240 [Trichodesmium sp. St2_bin2_1]|nr:hypothetical protein [Trichodesmium sp. St2_bin2_1]